MLHHRRDIDLSVIISSNRPQWLANCLHQLHQQIHHLKVEVVIVVEGCPNRFQPVRERYPCARWFFKGIEGRAGAFAKDFGISQAFGVYVCFWDDDNLYLPLALQQLYDAALGADIGICRATIMALNWLVVPEDEEIRWANLDTMGLCVRRKLAMKARWSAHGGRGTDYYWVKKLLEQSPVIRFSRDIVGDHL